MVCLAVDATGDGPDDEVLSISILTADGSAAYDGLFRPWRHTSWPEAERESGIGPEEVASSPSLCDCIDSIQRVVDAADEIIGYDLGRPVRLLRDAGVDLPQGKLVDTADRFSRVYGRLGGGRRARMPLLSAARIALEDEFVDVRRSGAAAAATLAVQKWADAAELELAQQAFVSRWVAGHRVVESARAMSFAAGAVAGMEEADGPGGPQ